MQRIKCAVCGKVNHVDEDIYMDGLPEGWVVNEDDYTFRCEDWECQDAGLQPEDIGMYVLEDEEEEF